MNHRTGPILDTLDSPPRLTLLALAIGIVLLAAACLSGRLNVFAVTHPPSLPEHFGKLEPTLVPAERAQTKTLPAATDQERAALPGEIAVTDQVFVGDLELPKGKRAKLALVEPAHGDPYVFADVNLDGALEASERFRFAPKQPFPQMILQMELPIGPFKTYPLRLVLLPARKESSGDKGDRIVARSFFVFVQGVVEIGGKPVRTLYTFDPDKGDADPDNGWMGMDTNGDGVVEQSTGSDEFTYAKDEVVLFRVNGRDVSTASIDLKSGTFVVIEHPAGANTRLSLRVGDALSDFAFTGTDGKSHHFSELHGKYVLLDFWETSCIPCRQEMPFIEKAWQRFHSRDFVALGINDDGDAKKARQFLTQQGIGFPQAIGPAAMQLVEKRFRIEAFPTEVLVNRAGKIVAMDNSLRGENLQGTLDKLLQVH